MSLKWNICISKARMFSIFFSSIMILCTIAWSAEQEKTSEHAIYFEADLNTGFATIGDPIFYTLRLEYASNIEILTPLDVQVPRALEKKKEEFTKIPIREGWKGVAKRFEFRPKKVGNYLFEPSIVRYRLPDKSEYQISSKKLYLTIESVVKIGDISNIRPPKSLQSLLPQIESRLQMLLTILIALLLLFLILKVIFRKRAETIARNKPRPMLPADRYIMKIDALHDSELLKTGEIKEYYQELSDTLKHYFEEQFGIQVMEKTRREMMKELPPMYVRKNDRELMDIFFTESEMVKFARHHPEAFEIQRYWRMAKDIINQTRSSGIDAALHLPDELIDENEKASAK